MSSVEAIGRLDLVLSFNVVHDKADPTASCARVLGTLADGGVPHHLPQIAGASVAVWRWFLTS